MQLRSLKWMLWGIIFPICWSTKSFRVKHYPSLVSFEHAYLCLCVRAHKVMCVTGSYKYVWAPEEGGPRPGLPDTGGKAKHWALILIQTHVHLNIHTHTKIYHTGPPELTDASCPAAKSTELHTHTNTHIQHGPGTPTGWPRGHFKGAAPPVVLFWCFC